MIKVSPSVLAADFSRLGEEIKKIEVAGADYVHLDVMDGIFVPNISFGAPVIKSVRPNSKLVFDTHLMITDPIRYIDDFVKAGSDIITFHYESCDNQTEVIDKIHSYGIKAGIVIKPDTDPEVLRDYVDKVEMVLIMSVMPGYGGQKFMPIALDNIKACRGFANEKGIDLDIEVDGGIYAENVSDVINAGANIIVAGSAVFKSNDTADTIRKLRG